MQPTPKVTTLCGSKKFTDEFHKTAIKLVQEGHVVLMPLFLSEMEGTEELAKTLGDMHLRKIDLADEIFVIDVHRYIGASTQREIDYARQNQKKIRYYSQE